MAEEIEVIESETAADLFDFVAVARNGPERHIVRVIRVPDAELIVVVELDAVLRQKILEALEVIVRKSGSAVQRQQLHRTVPDAVGPDVVFAVDFDQLRASRLDLGGPAAGGKQDESGRHQELSHVR